MVRWVLRLRLVAHVVIELLLVCGVACRALGFIGVVSVAGRHLLVVRALARELSLLHGVEGGSLVLLLAVLRLHHEVLLRDGMISRLVEVRGVRVALCLVSILVVHVLLVGTLLARGSCGLRGILPFHRALVSSLKSCLQVDSSSGSSTSLVKRLMGICFK